MNKDINIVWKPIDGLIPYENNAKQHNEQQIRNLMTSLERFDWMMPCLVTEDNVIVVGHGRTEAARRLGMTEAPCLVVSNLTADEIDEYRVMDNLLAEGNYDKAKLQIEMRRLDIKGYDLTIEKAPIEITPAEIETDDLGLIDKSENHRSMQNDAFENQEVMQFPCNTFYGIPELSGTQTTGDKFLRFMDWREIDDYENYIAHFYYDDYKFMSAWREPNKFVERLMKFKAVIAPDFSLYTDFPRALQILSCYRRNWCGAYWQYLGIDVIPDVVWGDKESFDYCFDGLPSHSTVAVSSVGVKRDKEWNGDNAEMFKAGYDEMLNRLKPTTILYYGTLIDGLDGNIIHIPSFYDEKRDKLNEMARAKKDGTWRKQNE